MYTKRDKILVDDLKKSLKAIHSLIEIVDKENLSDKYGYDISKAKEILKEYYMDEN